VNYIKIKCPEKNTKAEIPNSSTERHKSCIIFRVKKPKFADPEKFSKITLTIKKSISFLVERSEFNSDV